MDDDRIRRRDLLGAVSGAMAGLAIAGDAAARGDARTITVHRRPDGPDAAVDVPERWETRLRASRRAHRRLRGRLRAREDVAAIGRVAGTDAVEGLRIPELRVYATGSPVLPTEAVPDCVDGVPVGVAALPSTSFSACGAGRCFGTVDCVPGGTSVGTFDPDADDAACCSTGCCTVTRDEAVYYKAAAHAFVDCAGFGSTDLEGRYLVVANSESRSGATIGRVADYDYDYDTVLVEPGADADVPGYDEHLVPDDRPVGGFVTRDGVEYLRDAGRRIDRFGAYTCRQSGRIRGILSDYRACDDRPATGFAETVVSSVCQADGDSGGPTYVPVPDGDPPYLSMIGQHVAGPASGAPSIAVPTYAAAEAMDFAVGGETC